jgi:hypothetical protein
LSALTSTSDLSGFPGKIAIAVNCFCNTEEGGIVIVGMDQSIC